MLNRYRLHFFGRRIGALGTSGNVQVDVEAETAAEARQKAYETHEHISGGTAGVVATQLPHPKATP